MGERDKEDEGKKSRRGRGYLSVFCECCVVRWRSLRRADHSSRGVLPSVIVKPRQRRGPGPRGLSSGGKEASSIEQAQMAVQFLCSNVFRLSYFV
jgi:hypothetical protein